MQGEGLTGGTSGATATVPSAASDANKGYLVQNTNWVNTRIEGNVHFESGGSGVGAAAIGIRFRNRENRGNGAISHYINAGSMGVTGTMGAVGVQLEAMGHVEIEGRFAQGADEDAIKLDANCFAIHIKYPTRFGTTGINLNSMDRDELNLSEFNVTLRRPEYVTGLESQSAVDRDRNDYRHEQRLSVLRDSRWPGAEGVGLQRRGQ